MSNTKRIDIEKYRISVDAYAAEVFDLPAKADGTVRMIVFHAQMGSAEWNAFLAEPKLKELQGDVVFLMSPGNPAYGIPRDEVAVYDLPGTGRQGSDSTKTGAS